jgi:hypothetical protein
MKNLLFASGAAGVLAVLASSPAAVAAPILVSTIDGAYDAYVYDTPSLTIYNTTPYAFTNVQLELVGYQDINNGLDQTRSISDVAANSSYAYVWLDGYGGTVAGDLFSYDYDDEYGQTTTNAACVQPYALCSFVGNFEVKFTALWNNPNYNSGAGTEISSVFSPANNATGGFVGWEGLDPSGLSETTYDDHVGTPNGVLANIYVGPPAVINPNGVPEPATWAMLILGLGAVGVALRRRQVAVTA